MEKTTRITPPRPAALESVAAQQVARVGRAMRCVDCFYRYIESINGTPPLGICHRYPFNMALNYLQQGMRIECVPRVVADDFFCHEFKALKPD